MFRHNLLLIYRSCLRFRSTFFINLIGLSTGLACALLIYLWVNDELNVDKFHVKGDRLYQIMSNVKAPEGIKTEAGTGDLLGETLVKELPEVEYATVITPPFWFEKFTVSAENNNAEAIGNFVSKDFFNVFSYNLTQGNNDQVLSDKNSIVISEKLAKNLFHTTEGLIGKTVEWKWLTHKRSCIISGIFKGTPSNSTYQFDFVISFEIWKEIVPGTSVQNGPYLTFITLRKGAGFSDFNAKILEFNKRKFDSSLSALFARLYSDGYLYGKYEQGNAVGGRIEYVKLFSGIGFLIMIIACINFMNLSTAKASRRIREVGIKKAMGARRRILILQYLTESVLMAFFSLLMAVVIVELCLPQFNGITGKNLTINFDINLIMAVFVITLLTGVIAGSYPALYLSRFNPAIVLTGKVNSSKKELLTRQGLVIFQFSLSIIFIVAVIIVYKQIEFTQTKDLGYNKDHVIYFQMEGKTAENIETSLSEIKKIPGVINVSSVMHNIIVTSAPAAKGLRWEDKNQDDKVRFAPLSVNYDLIETLGIEMKEGRSFSRDFSSDSSSIIFNEAAITAMEIKDPVGKTVNLWGKEKQIIGVTKNFHFQSLHEEVKPLIFLLQPQYTMLIMVKVEEGKERETIFRLQKFNAAYNPGFTLNYKFLDQAYQEQYISEKRVSVLSKYFATLTIIISCLGLFGLAAFTVEKRIKEIGIRKVLGATEIGVAYLLSGEFTKMIFISIGIAIPISYIIVKNWLDTFAYRIALDPLYFFSAACGTLMIAWLTVGTQTMRASKMNPSECLRDE